ncbi:ionotropic receptor 21a-like [Macrobrachium nipponense]|uniref:ionotropic receptor 21a-like n=1 Tax=Macrobrachium nipponense TaxID=159736 RepID=UPI0030C7E471
MNWLMGLLFLGGVLNPPPSSEAILHQQQMKLLGSFLQELEKVYFEGCSLIVFYNSSLSEEQRKIFQPNGKSEGGEHQSLIDVLFSYARNSTKIVFSLKEDLPDILGDIDLNTRTRCPVYLTVSSAITDIHNLFLLANKDWDKYFLSRKHLIFTESPAVDIDNFLRADELNTMTRLLILRPGSDSESLQVVTNRPYSMNPRYSASHRLAYTLTTWRGRVLDRVDAHFFPDKLTNFFGYQMRVVTFHFPPRIFMIEEEDSFQLYGVDIDVVQALSEALNFSLVYSRPSDNEMWGWEKDDGNWTGLMGDLQHRRADIGVADLYIMEPYFAIIDMSIAYDIEYLCFVNVVPGPLPQWMALGAPFLLNAWIAVLISILAGMVLFVFIVKLGLLSGNESEAPWFQDISNLCLYLYASVMNTTLFREPRASHLRIFTVFWSIAFFILASAYKGSLISFLTVPLEQAPIDTHRQLYEKRIDVGSIGYTLKRVMEKNADRFVRLLALRYQHVPSTDEGLQRTLKGKYSFLESRGFLDYTIAVYYTDKRGRPSLHAMREYIAPFGIGLAYPKYVPYIEKFNQVIRRLTEAGFAKKWMADIILRSKRAKVMAAETNDQVRVAEGPGEISSTNNVFQPLSLDNLQGGFILLGIGLLLSAVAFVFESLAKQICGGTSAIC